MYEPMWQFLLTYESHEMRLTGFRRLTLVNGTPGNWGFTKFPNQDFIGLLYSKTNLNG